jgi:hypothetical protein
MKKLIIAILLLTFVTSCNKDEKDIAKVEITFDADAKYKPDGFNWSTNCIRNHEVYMKKGDNLSFESIVCNTQEVLITIKVDKNVIYQKRAKIHNVSVHIP